MTSYVSSRLPEYKQLQIQNYSMDYNKRQPIGQNFHSNDHSLNRDTKFTIIRRLEKFIGQHHEDKWRKRLQTLTPIDFNIKLNHPLNTALK